MLVVKNPPANTGRDVGSIPGLERSLEKGMATHSSILAWRILMDSGAWWVTIHGVTKCWTRLSDQTELNSTELVHSIKIPPDYLLKPSSYFQLGHFFLSLGLFFSLIIPMGFPSSSSGKESTCTAGNPGSIPGLRGFPGGGHGNPLQYSCLENPHRQRSLAGYSPLDHKESNVTECLSIAHINIFLIF